MGASGLPFEEVKDTASSKVSPLARAAGRRTRKPIHPKAYHRAYPDNPVPSTAAAVLRDTGPDGRPYRLAFHRARSPNEVRAAAVFEAGPSWDGPTTKAELIPETGMWVQGNGKVAACWDGASGPVGVVDPELLGRVRDTAARAGLAPTG